MNGTDLFGQTDEGVTEDGSQEQPARVGADADPRYIPIGSGELIQLLGTGILRPPDPSWNPFPPSRGVVVRSVVQSELSSRIREISLPKGRSSLVILEVSAPAEAMSEAGVALSQVAAIHVPDEKTWLKQDARFLQGDGWTLGGIEIRVSPDLFEVSPAELEIGPIDMDAPPAAQPSRIDRCMGGLTALLLADWMDVDFRGKNLANVDFESMNDISVDLVVGVLGLDDLEAARFGVLVDVLFNRSQSAIEERIEDYFRTLSRSPNPNGWEPAKKRIQDIVDSRTTQQWSALTDDEDVVFRALTCASLEPDVSRLNAFLHAESDDRPGDKVAALALFITGAIAGVPRVPKRDLPEGGTGFLPVTELGLGCFETEPDEHRDEIMSRAARITGGRAESVGPRGFSIFKGKDNYRAEIKRSTSIQRLIISVSLPMLTPTGRKKTGKGGLAPKDSHEIFTKVSPHVNCRVMPDLNEKCSIRLESGLLIGTIDDPELAAAYEDLIEAVDLCRKRLDCF